MEIWVYLAQAIMCFSQFTNCQPVLVGKSANPTPIGTFKAYIMKTPDPGYNGYVFGFAEDKHDAMYSIHKIWTLVPSENRQWRIDHGDANDRHISHGCINIPEQTFLDMKSKSQVWTIHILADRYN